MGRARLFKALDCCAIPYQKMIPLLAKWIVHSNKIWQRMASNVLQNCIALDFCYHLDRHIPPMPKKHSEVTEPSACHSIWHKANLDHRLCAYNGLIEDDTSEKVHPLLKSYFYYVIRGEKGMTYNSAADTNLKFHILSKGWYGLFFRSSLAGATKQTI